MGDQLRGESLLKKHIKEVILFIILTAILCGCMKSSVDQQSEDSVPQIVNQSNGVAEEKTTEESGSIESSQEEDTSDFSEVNCEGQSSSYVFDYDCIPEYSGLPAIELNNNVPLFEETEKIVGEFEYYSELDDLGRCGVAYANLSKDTMPNSERGPMGSLKPSGWHTVKYNDLIDGNYLYNRCHLIGYQLAGENDNMKNLMTGTRYLNIQGMLPFENTVSGYIESTGNHVLYRVTPIFGDKNLVAYGVTVEGYSIEDNGVGICFFAYLYNVQPGIIIDYLSGDSYRDPEYSVDITRSNGGDDEQSEETEETTEYPEGAYVLNTNTHKFHYPTCSSVADMAERNKKISMESRGELIMQGYSPCKRCNP